MVRHEVVDNTDSTLASRFTECNVVIVTTQSWIDTVEVSDRVAVVRAFFLIVFEYWGHPKLSHPKRFEVAQILGDTREVSPMTAVGVLPIRIFVKSGY